MKRRLNAFAAAPGPMRQWLELGRSIHQGGLEESLMALVEIRASQINGCAYCLHMHTADARKAGEREERIFLLDAWRESQMYTPRERAALAWTEALTLIAGAHPAEEVYEELRAHFTEEEQVRLTLVIVMINGWNRINVGFHAVHPAEEGAAGRYTEG